MFSHVTVGAEDLHRLAHFHDSALGRLGPRRREVTPDSGAPAACWVRAGEALPRFQVYVPFDGRPAAPGNGRMVVVLARSPGAVREAHVAGLTPDRTDEGGPGERPHHGPGYHGARLRDPAGDKLHVVHRGAAAAD